MMKRLTAALIVAVFPLCSRGSSPDPQVKTNHPYYPGELSCSTFPRLFRTEAELYERVTGRTVASDEDKALAAWYWRNTHYAHAEEGASACFSSDFKKGEKARDYWTGLFAHGFALCGTTHAQWCAEMDALLGHGRSRVAGVEGHNSFEVYLTGGAYGSGRWALLDHDISTVMYDDSGTRLLGLDEIVPRINTLKDPNYKPERQHGWRVAGLHDDDAGGVYTSYTTAEYLAGYAAAPPMVHLRPGESMRRYLAPGLEDGKTFVFWGLNYQAGDVPGPMRDRTWVNQPEKMFNSKSGTGYKVGQARFANAVYDYTPDFTTAKYQEGVIEETQDHVTFEFYTPYVIAATPPDNGKWAIYEAGGKNGLVVNGSARCAVKVSVDQGQTWKDAGILAGRLDLTDLVKGEQQYFLRFEASASSLVGKNVSWRTVCECNSAIIPRVQEGENKVTFESTQQAIASAGPDKMQAAAHLVQGKLDASGSTLELVAPRGGIATHLYAASWDVSGAPPGSTSWKIEYSIDQGGSWLPIVADWKIPRRPPEPKDFWSQSFCWGDVALPAKAAASPIRVRFSNDGGKSYRKVEAHLSYTPKSLSPTEVTFAWRVGGATKTVSHTYAPGGAPDASWSFTAAPGAETFFVEYRCR